ncbi:MAG: ribose-phosphate diphosphokinase [Candidatus Diapherotrites archaeon]|nr:ribose-phosphate diphosphokinase [Candidatus Diapherotrites archaeon]
MNSIIFGLSNSNNFEKNFAKEMKSDLGKFNSEQFPDGELHLKFDSKIKGKKVFLVQSLALNPNTALIELFFAARAAKDSGAKKVFGIIPYLAYMRQDKEFHAGEIVSAHHLASILNNSLDGIIAVDPHLHRIRKMNEVFFKGFYDISSVPAIAEFIAKKFNAENTVIVGPDWESFQWARHVANKINFKAIIFRKERFSARRVKVHYSKEIELKGKNVIIIDDMISTGHTMIEAVKELKKNNPKAIYAVCVHALLVENAEKKLKNAGIKEIYSCNTVPGKTNKIHLEKMVAEEAKKKFLKK